MAEDIKFTEDEMTSLKQLQEDYTTKQEQLGQISVQRILLNQQIDSLEQRQEQIEKEYVEVQQREQSLVKTLNDKYGQGQLDPNTGVFTPTK
jgi:septal ring factor EnvC (AmiA/AmiB activator)|tara:strand:- start:60 stop:335 length:276 start_codon:yes stop_codon:yes gene_type:complete